MKTVTSIQMRDIEVRAMRDFGLSELIMMENAGRSIADAVETLFRKKDIPKGKKISIFCGGGNNGGDGMVAARHLHNRNYEPEIILLKSPEILRDISLANFTTAEKSGIPIKLFTAALKLENCGLIIDSLLGTGTRGSVREPYLSAINFINERNVPVIAVDIPSGICADSGEVLETAIRADLTVAMGVPKCGLIADKAKKYVGSIFVADIGLPKAILDSVFSKS
jgi:NAD(P)H-hydrate epimerase